MVYLMLCYVSAIDFCGLSGLVEIVIDVFVFCDFIYSCVCGFIQEFYFDTDSVYSVEQPCLSFRRLLRVLKRVQKQLPRMYFHQTNLKQK